MKILTAVIAGLLFSLVALCQHSQLSFSDDFKITEKSYKNQTITHSVYLKDNFYTAVNSGVSAGKWLFTKLYDVKFSITISKFDRNMNKIKDFELQKGANAFGPLMPELFLLNSKLFLAYFQSDNSSSFNLYIAPVDENDLALREAKKICTFKQENVGVFKIESVINGSLVSFCNSPGDKNVLVACKSAPNAIQTFVLDDQLNVRKQSTVQVNTAEFDISSAALTDNGLECLVLDGEHETKISYISPDGKKTQKSLRASGNLNPYFTRASTSRDGKSIYIYSAASLSDQKDAGCSGLLLWQLDCNTLQLSKTFSYPFSPEFIETVARKGGGIKSRRETYMFRFDPVLVELDNGNLAILGSPERTTTETGTKTTMDMHMNMQTSQVATTSTSVGPVIAFFPDKDGKSFEYVLIPRASVFSKSARSGYGAIQVVQAPGLNHSPTSFIAGKTGDDIVVLYNDNESNLAKGVDEKITTSYSSGKLVIAEALISKDRKLEYRKQIGDKMKGNYTYYLGYAIPNASSTVILPIGKEGAGFNARKTFYSNWCFISFK